MSEITRTYIEGNTYPVKDQLKQLGCKWDGDRRAWYAPTAEIATAARAIVGPHPLYNSPPPADLGTVDPVALATKFGRQAIAGATVKSFTGYGKPAAANGRIVKSKTARYVQVAHTNPRYFSRDMLEDFDMFGDEPGHQYQWDGVEVEPNDAERAADQTAADAQEARKRAVATLKAAAERVRDQGEYPTGKVSLPFDRGTERIAAEKDSNWSGPRVNFIVTPEWIWLVRDNGADGDDWSCNNVSGAIAHRLPFDAALADEIRAAAKLLGYKIEVEKGEPARTKIETEHGSVYQYGHDSTVVRIDWKPAEPVHGHSELTDGRMMTVKGEEVIGFRETIKVGKKKDMICARITGRPELVELIQLAEQLKAELVAHYGEEND